MNIRRALPWGHSVTQLIKKLPDRERASFADLREAALHLDKLYIPTRYPDALVELIPAEAYTQGEAEQACEQAATVVARVGTWLEEYSGGGEEGEARDPGP